jgi:meso-butanediol dehydrogenase/(S,S)-butanediol dehydrogenase/diacetyl reductase
MQLQLVGSTYPLRRCGETEDIANAIVYLSSQEASWVTGVLLPLDGGFTMTNGTAPMMEAAMKNMNVNK